MTPGKDKNIKYLRKVYILKKIFLPVLVMLNRVGLVKPLGKLINSLIRVAGIKKNVNYFFKYKDFSSMFRDQFRNSEPGPGIVLFPLMTGVNGNFTLLNLLYSKYLIESDNLKPVFLVCDSAVKICSRDGMLKSRKTNPLFCYECWDGYKDIESATGIETRYFTDLVDPGNESLISINIEIDRISTIDECIGFRFNNLPVGEYCKKSVLRYFLVGTFDGRPKEVEVYREYLKSASYYTLMMETYLTDNPEVKYMIIYNGTLGFESIARHYASLLNINYITQEVFLGQNGLIYKRNGEVMNLDWSDDYEKFTRTFKVDAEAIERTDTFFSDLKSGKLVYKTMNREHQQGILNDIGRYVCLFTNMNFDTAVLDRNSIFSSMEDWLNRVIDSWDRVSSGVTLVIRIHPGESKLVTASREFMGDRIRGKIAGKNNILIIDSVEKVNSYELISGMQYAMIYSSTIGLETAYLGKPCVVAGMPYFRNKSFVISPASQDEYFETIARLNKNLYRFEIDRNELVRTVNFVYFDRLKRINGIKVYTPEEEPNTIYKTPGEMIEGNRKFLQDFRNELIGDI
ncbi:MAG: hypothetical protein E4G95_00090 [Bacteroidia bacterium]|nr:MAG: hypothetical protein E4G95_00090 [Bacteroidia bacterium]